MSTDSDTQTGATAQSEYLAHYLAPLSQPFEADWEGLTVILREMDRVDAPADIPAPPIDELLDAALWQRTEEHQAELRRQVKHSALTLAQQVAHLQATAEEVAHLESVIHEFSDASRREEAHLKSEIAALQLSKERDVQHLQGEVQHLQRKVVGISAERDGLGDQLKRAVVDAQQSSRWMPRFGWPARSSSRAAHCGA